MQKFIAAVDGFKFSESTVSYATYLVKRENAHLVGVMLDDITYRSYKIYDLLGNDGLDPEKLKKKEIQDKATRIRSANRFEQLCSDAGIKYKIHHDRNIALQELLHESIYADMVIIDSKETLTHYEEKLPTRFIRNLLSDVQCPVLLLPQKFKQVNKIIFLYDGGPSSVYAIKMFSYLLPSFKDAEIEVVSVKTGKQSLHVPDNLLMKEFMKRHFPKAVYTVLKGFPEIEIVQHLKKQKTNSLVVAGAYKRGTVSRWFKASIADALMEQIKMPIFVAHYK
jgi:nucleotide-binding universal stress UspA family protein